MSKNAKKDTLSQLKEEQGKLNKKPKEEEEDLSEEEEEDKNQNVVKEQTIQKTDRPKNLKDIFASIGNETKAKPKKHEKKDTKPKKKYDDPVKPQFFNAKGTGNANKIDNEARKNKQTFKNAEGLNAAAKDNQKIKHTKDYLEKDSQKEYYEEVEKPQFTTKIKEGDDNFVELNQKEDVRINIFIFYFNVYSS